ncbi:MAG: carboxyl transferase domain-containing protein [Cellvibrionaceae bacterium]
MPINRLLIANRGEIAIRIAQSAAENGIETLAIFSEDDKHSLHLSAATQTAALSGKGTQAYLDQRQIIDLAIAHQCDAIHPGYGFLSENADFATLCANANITFVGPTPETLNALGDKAKARTLAIDTGLPLPAGTDQATTLAQAKQFFDTLPEGSAMMIKAIAGGGGRGMRPVESRDDIDNCFQRCQSEALAAFGNGDLYVEQKIQAARHIEIQILGDGLGKITTLGERECSLQRRHQKVIEVTPSPSVTPALREKLEAAAVSLATALNYRSLGTIEFLVDSASQEFYFMEANPRIQVEHTITEAVYNVDLVAAQLSIADGQSLDTLNLTQSSITKPTGYAVQARINLEQADASGNFLPSSGRISRYEMATGIGVRVDSCGYQGFVSSAYYDSLLAKLVVHTRSNDFSVALQKTARKLSECSIEGINTNIDFLCNILEHADVIQNNISTQFIDQNIKQLTEPRRTLNDASSLGSGEKQNQVTQSSIPDHWLAVTSPMQAVVVSVDFEIGDAVIKGQTLAIVEAMKMEHVVVAPASGKVTSIEVESGDSIFEAAPIVCLDADESDEQHISEQQQFEIDLVRQDLQEFFTRKSKTFDDARPEAVAKRHSKGMNMARENIAALVDEDSFQEYGSLTIAAQRRRRSLEELIATSPADGLVAGTASINRDLFDESRSRCMVMSYDYTVFAGTQGAMNHKKTDRMLRLANEQKIPLIFFTEGGGGRPGDTDYPVVAGLDIDTWTSIATLSGQVPIIGITAGRCFAGNAALLGCSDVIIATKDSNIGMAGPAMIEGGGLGRFSPSEVGPSDIQSSNGVIDLLAEDESHAVKLAKQYLSYFQGTTEQWSASDQRRLRHHIPENRLRSYDIRAVIDDLADSDSALELRAQFGAGIITSLIRIEGRPFGLIANNSRHLGGAIDSPAADKASRFIKLCDAFDLPLINLCDTPGFMVGPEAEKQAQVRHFSRMFVGAANASIPMFNIVLRKGYGLGAMAMTGGSFHSGVFTVAWPTGEFGAMGLEGAVRLGFRKELEAISDPAEQKVLFDKLVAAAYEKGKAINMASTLEIDEVIDPQDTRQWIIRGLRASAPAALRNGKKLRYIDTW